MASRKGLGRGLGNLLDTSIEISEEKSKSGIVEIPIEQIRISEDNPRKKFDESSIDELASTIREHGLLQPILVLAEEDYYTVVSGERRLRAIRRLSLKTAPCIIKNLTKRATLEVSLIENIQREQLDPIEEASVYKKLINDHGLTQEKVSSQVGKSRVTIANRIRLLNLPESLQLAVADGRVTEGQVRPLLGIKSEARQLKLLMEIEKHGYNSRQIEKLVKSEKEKKIKNKNPNKEDPVIKKLKSELEEYLSTRVDIKHNIEKGNGKISIDFFSNDDLDRLLNTIGYVK